MLTCLSCCKFTFSLSPSALSPKLGILAYVWIVVPVLLVQSSGPECVTHRHNNTSTFISNNMHQGKIFLQICTKVKYFADTHHVMKAMSHHALCPQACASVLLSTKIAAAKSYHNRFVLYSMCLFSAIKSWSVFLQLASMSNCVDFYFALGPRLWVTTVSALLISQCSIGLLFAIKRCNWSVFRLSTKVAARNNCTGFNFQLDCTHRALWASTASGLVKTVCF